MNPPMAKGGGGGVDTNPPTGFSNFSQNWEEVYLQTKFLPVGSSLGHLSMKKFCRLALILDKGMGAGGGGWQTPPIEQKLTYFANHKDDIQSWHILACSKIVSRRVCKKKLQYNQKQRHSDVIKFKQKQWNDKDFDPFLAENHSKLTIEDKHLIQ